MAGGLVRVVSLAAFCAALVCVLARAASAQTPVANVWVEVPVSYVMPPGRTGRVNGTSWNGITFKASTGTLFYYSRYVGEDLADEIYGNAVTAWDVAGKTVRALAVTDQDPISRHTYESFTYVDSADAIYMFYGAHMGCGADTVVWKFTLADNTWRRGSTPPDAYGCEVHTAYWKTGDKLLFIAGDSAGPYELDVRSDTWAKLTTTGRVPDVYGAHATWDARRDLWVFWNSNVLTSYDPATRAFVALPVAAGAAPAARQRGGITYVPKYDCYLIAGGTDVGDTWVYTIATQSWSQIAGATLPTENTTNIAYDPKTELVYGLIGIQGGDRRWVMNFSPGTPVVPPSDGGSDAGRGGASSIADAAADAAAGAGGAGGGAGLGGASSAGDATPPVGGNGGAASGQRPSGGCSCALASSSPGKFLASTWVVAGLCARRRARRQNRAGTGVGW
jgi:hypothetical protein